MILTLFTIVPPAHNRRVHAIYRHPDTEFLIRIGKDWENNEKKQYYTLTLEDNETNTRRPVCA